jgi:hypothetical protein
MYEMKVTSKQTQRFDVANAKSRDLLGNGGAGGKASCRGAGNPHPAWGAGNRGTANWGPALSPFPKRLGDDALMQW